MPPVNAISDCQRRSQCAFIRREMPSGSLSPVLATSGQRGFNRAAHAELKVAFPLSTSAFR